MNYVPESSEFHCEPVRGLPARLPKGEDILWQGAPDWRGFAAQALHVRAIAVLVAVMAAWPVVAAAFEGASIGAAVGEAVIIAAFGVGGIGVLHLLAWLVGRTTVYTITNRRIVMRVGVALNKTFNVPFATIDGASMQMHGDGTGSIAIALRPGSAIPYLMIWPHARPWHMALTQPMLRAIADPQPVAELLADAFAEELARRGEGKADPLLVQTDDAEAKPDSDIRDPVQEREMAARVPLMAAFSLPVIALVLVAATQFGKQGDVPQEMAAAEAGVAVGAGEANGAWLASWTLQFVDIGEDRLAVVRADTGERIAVMEAEGDGLLRSSIRSTEFARNINNGDVVSGVLSLQLVAWESGRITLFDEQTGKHLPLSSFGPFHTGAIVDVLELPRKALAERITAHAPASE